MLWELHQLVLAFHILLAIVWVGGVFFIGWGLYPSIRKWTFVEQRRIFSVVMEWSHIPLTIAGALVITSGIILGTALGPINEWNDIFHTRYGNIWLSALLIGLLTLAWGIFVGNREAIKLFSQEELWIKADTGDKKPLYNNLFRLIALESVEVIGFVVLIYLMISL